jgi:hypothetical protein
MTFPPDELVPSDAAYYPRVHVEAVRKDERDNAVTGVPPECFSGIAELPIGFLQLVRHAGSGQVFDLMFQPVGIVIPFEGHCPEDNGVTLLRPAFEMRGQPAL